MRFVASLNCTKWRPFRQCDKLNICKWKKKPSVCLTSKFSDWYVALKVLICALNSACEVLLVCDLYIHYAHSSWSSKEMTKAHTRVRVCACEKMSYINMAAKEKKKFACFTKLERVFYQREQERRAAELSRKCIQPDEKLGKRAKHSAFV